MKQKLIGIILALPLSLPGGVLVAGALAVWEVFRSGITRVGAAAMLLCAAWLEK